MLRFFRSSHTIVIVFVLLICGLTWLHAFICPGTKIILQHGTLLFLEFADLIKNFPELTIWIGLILMLLQTIMLIVVNNKLHLIDKISYLPALCYVLFTGMLPAIHQLNPVIIAVILLTIGFIQLIGSFDNEQLSYRYFTAPLFISVATFFYQYAYVYMLVVWFAILFLRPGYWREWVFSLLGYALPVFFAFSWFFLIEDNPMYIIRFFQEIFSVQHIIPDVLLSDIIFLGIGILLGIITFRHLSYYLGSKKIIIRNGYYLLFLIAVITLTLSAVVPGTIPLTWYLVAFPLSFILSNYLATVKSVLWGTVTLSVLFASMVIAQIIYYVQFF